MSVGGRCICLLFVGWTLPYRFYDGSFHGSVLLVRSCQGGSWCRIYANQNNYAEQPLYVQHRSNRAYYNIVQRWHPQSCSLRILELNGFFAVGDLVGRSKHTGVFKSLHLPHFADPDLLSFLSISFRQHDSTLIRWKTREWFPIKNTEHLDLGRLNALHHFDPLYRKWSQPHAFGWPPSPPDKRTFWMLPNMEVLLGSNVKTG